MIELLQMTLKPKEISINWTFSDNIDVYVGINLILTITNVFYISILIIEQM
jgi:hypothetical protein